MQELKYAFFDMDGTLVDSMAYWRGIINEYLAENGEDPLSEEDQRIIEDCRFAEGIRYFKSVRSSPHAQAFTPEEGMRILAKHYRLDVGLRPGIREMLEKLSARGVRMAVITATPHLLAELCLSVCGIRGFFDHIVGGDDFDGGKDAPDIFLHAMSLFDARPEQCMMVEDAYYSAKTAKALGMRIAVIEEEFQAHNKQHLLALADEYYAERDGEMLRLK